MADEPRRPRTISADWVLKRIHEGKTVRLKNTIIEGDLDLNKLDLPTHYIERTEAQKMMSFLKEDVKIVQSSITITDSIIRGRLDFCNSTFSGDTRFEGVTFSGDTRFDNASFCGNINFIESIFSENVGFIEANFCRDAGFIKVIFCKYAFFFRATFNEYAHFIAATFSGEACFGGASFCEHARFEGATFSRDAEFIKATFNGDARFDKATFGGKTRFDKATFCEYTGFGEATFNRDTSFDGTTFNKMVGFSRVTFREGITFFGTRFDKELNLDQAKYERLDTRWETVKYHLEYQGATYLTLIKNFRDLGFFDDADDCYYQYRRITQTKKLWYDWSKFLDVIAWITCGYGVKVWPTAICTLVFVVIFASLYGLFNGITTIGSSEISSISINIAPIVIQNAPTEVHAGVTSWADYLYFSAAALTGSTPAELHPNGAWKYAAVIERLIGYLFLALFVVVLTKKIIR